MRLIDSDALLTVPNVRKVTEYDETGGGITYLAVPVEAIEKAPTIEAEPVRHARWDVCEDDYAWWWVCSECGEHVYIYSDYCPNCGAKMDLEG